MVIFFEENRRQNSKEWMGQTVDKLGVNPNRVESDTCHACVVNK